MSTGQTADPFPKQWGFSLGQTAGVPSDGPGNHYRPLPGRLSHTAGGVCPRFYWRRAGTFSLDAAGCLVYTLMRPVEDLPPPVTAIPGPSASGKGIDPCSVWFSDTAAHCTHCLSHDRRPPMLSHRFGLRDNLSLHQRLPRPFRRFRQRQRGLRHHHAMNHHSLWRTGPTGAPRS